MPSIKTAIVGTKFYAGAQKLLDSMPEGTRLLLVREPENKYDSNAVAVHQYEPDPAVKLGHVNRHDAVFFAKVMDSGQKPQAILSQSPIVEITWMEKPGLTELDYNTTLLG